MSSRKKQTILRTNLSLCTYEGLAAMPIVFLCLPGNFIVAMLLSRVFKLSDTSFGIIVSLPFWANVLQLVAIPLLMRRWSQKQITVRFAWLHIACWGVLAVALPHIPIDNPEISGRVLFWIFLIASLTFSIVSVSWTSWVQEWAPARVRGKYFGRRNRLLQIATVAFVIAAGQSLYALSETNPIEAFQLVIAFGIVCRTYSVIAQGNILSTSTTPPHEASADWNTQFKLLRDADGFKRLVLFGALFGFAANLFGPFFNVFMFRELGMPVTHVSWLVVLATGAGAVSLPAWGNMLDRFGNKPVMVFTIVAWMAPGYLWLFVEPGRTWMLYPMWAWGGFISAGFLLGSFNLLLKLVPPGAKTISISIQVAATALATAIAPVIGGSLLDLCRALGFSRLDVIHGVAVFHHTAVIATAFALHRVTEPAATSLRQVVGAMLSYRQIGALLGVSFLGQYTFLRRRPPEVTSDPK
jgi:MFS family permease